MHAPKTSLNPVCTQPTPSAHVSGSAARDDNTSTATAVGVSAGICCLLGTVAAAMSLWKMAKVRPDLQVHVDGLEEPGAETAPELEACLSCPEPDATAPPDHGRGLTPRPASFNPMYETSAPATVPLPWPPTLLPILLPTGHGPVAMVPHPASSGEPFEGIAGAPVFPLSISGSASPDPFAGLAVQIGGPMPPPQGPVPDEPPPSYAETLHRWRPETGTVGNGNAPPAGGNTIINVDGNHDSSDEEL